MAKIEEKKQIRAKRSTADKKTVIAATVKRRPCLLPHFSWLALASTPAGGFHHASLLRFGPCAPSLRHGMGWPPTLVPGPDNGAIGPGEPSELDSYFEGRSHRRPHLCLFLPLSLLFSSSFSLSVSLPLPLPLPDPLSPPLPLPVLSLSLNHPSLSFSFFLPEFLSCVSVCTKTCCSAS